MAEAKKTPRSDASSAPEPETHEHDQKAAATCPVAWCPVCLAVSTVQPVRPDVVEHLLKAGTEFLMAMRAVIDARADGMTGDSSNGHKARLEKIDIG
jgi:hypothetical protein